MQIFQNPILIYSFQLWQFNKGLWNERLYLLFDYDQSKTISFEEFMTGISKFLKRDKNDKIYTLFKLYDLDNNGKIEKIEFQKMLYNYPQEDIEVVIQVLKNFSPQYIFQIRNQNQAQMVAESVMNFRNNESNINTGRRSMQSVSLDRIDSQFFDNKQQRSNSVEADFLAKELQKKYKINKKVFPSSFNNQIKLIANIIFDKYAENDQMSLENFSQWINLHQNFLKSFDTCFRPYLWEIQYQDGYEQLGYQLLIPDLTYNLLIKFKNKKKQYYQIKFYDMFMFIFDDEQKQLPYRIIILKGLQLIEVQEQNKIILKHISKQYNGFEIYANDLNQVDYMELYNYMNSFINDNFFKNYMIIEKLGRGKYSEVHKVICQRTGEYFAMKIIPKEGLTKEEHGILDNESRIMKVLRHDNIVKFYHSLENQQTYQFIMEYFDGEDLYNYIENNPPISEEEASFIMKQLFQSMIYVHQSGIIHRDLKPENVMVQFNKYSKKIEKIKLIDFGLSCYYTELQKNSAEIVRCGTLNYSAPEVIDINQTYDERCDIYSLGVIMYYILFQNLPFQNENSNVLQHIIKQGILDLDHQDKFISEEAKQLLMQLLDTDQDRRITLLEAKNHIWISNKNFFHQKSFQKKKSFLQLFFNLRFVLIYLNKIFFLKIIIQYQNIIDLLSLLIFLYYDE